MSDLQKQEQFDGIKLRGGIEVCLKNAFTGEEILHEKDDNVVLYIGRNWVMNKVCVSNSLASTDAIWAGIKIGTGNTATQATHTGLLGYYSFKSGTMNLTTQSGGTGVPVMNVVASWDTGALTDTQFNSIWEFCLANSSGHHTSGINLCRYVSATYINATTSNQLLVTYSVSF